MSVNVRRAIYGKLSADTPLNALLGSPASGFTRALYYEVAPQGSGFPYVIFSKLAGTPSYALGSRAYDAEVWLVKAIDRSATADGADAIQTRLNELLTDGALSISGSTQLYLRRESDTNYAEPIDGVIYRHAGSNFRLVYQ